MKKLLSIILATAMLISLIPAVFAADTEAEAGIKIVYDFYNADLAALTSGVEFPLKNLSYTASKGFWQYADNSDNSRTYVKTNAGTGFRADSGYIKTIARNESIAAGTSGHEYWVAFKLNVPKSGNYEVEIKANAGKITYNTWLEAYIFKADSVAEVAEGVKDSNRIRDKSITFTKNAESADDEEHVIGSKNFAEAGEYYFVFMPSTSRTGGGGVYKAGGYVFLKQLTLTEGDGTQSVPMYYPGEIEDIQLEVGDSKEVTGTMTHWSNGDEYDGEPVTYTGESGNDDVAVYENNKIVAKGAGNTTITVKSSDGYFVRDVNVKVVKQDEALIGAFVQDAAKEDVTKSYTAPTVAGLEINGSVINPDSNGDGSYNLTAPETKGDKKFLYWAKGMETEKRIISFSNVLEKYVPDSTGITYLIAVYEGDITDTKNEYYNINGQLIAKQADAPTDLPSIPGLGKAEGWDPCGGNIYVARYADKVRDNVTVTAVDCTVNGEVEAEVAYGDLVTCTADAQDASGNPFKCWTKKGVNEEAEIVSIDESYTFHAWEDCTVEAVYADHYYTGSSMKIIIDSFDIDTGVTGVMAEFIGLDNAVEKGIMFTATGKTEAIKIPMTTTDNQLAVVADGVGTYTGYAILKEDTAYKKITDGSYPATAE